MGRGAQADTRRLTDQQLSLQNAWNQQLFRRGQSLESTVAAGYRNLLASPGFTDAQKSATTNQSMGALASAFAALASRAANRRARTRNSAGFGDLLGELAREKGRQGASLAQKKPAGLCQPVQAESTHSIAGAWRTLRRQQHAARTRPGRSCQFAQRARQRLPRQRGRRGFRSWSGLGALGRIFG